MPGVCYSALRRLPRRDLHPLETNSVKQTILCLLLHDAPHVDVNINIYINCTSNVYRKAANGSGEDELILKTAPGTFPKDESAID